MESDHPEPVVRNWIAGFFIAALVVVAPLSAIYSERVKSTYKGIQPETNGCTETNSKRSLPTVDAGYCLRIPS